MIGLELPFAGGIAALCTQANESPSGVPGNSHSIGNCRYALDFVCPTEKRPVVCAAHAGWRGLAQRVVQAERGDGGDAGGTALLPAGFWDWGISPNLSVGIGVSPTFGFSAPSSIVPPVPFGTSIVHERSPGPTDSQVSSDRPSSFLSQKLIRIVAAQVVSNIQALESEASITDALALSDAFDRLADHFDGRPEASLSPESLAGTASAKEFKKEAEDTFNALPDQLGDSGIDSRTDGCTLHELRGNHL